MGSGDAGGIWNSDLRLRAQECKHSVLKKGRVKLAIKAFVGSLILILVLGIMFLEDPDVLAGLIVGPITAAAPVAFVAFLFYKCGCFDCCLGRCPPMWLDDKGLKKHPRRHLCPLCLSRVSKKRWADGTHRLKCQQHHRDFLKKYHTLAFPDVRCRTCQGEVKLWQHKTRPKYHGCNGGTPKCKNSESLTNFENNGMNLYTCYTCDIRLCLDCCEYLNKENLKNCPAITVQVDNCGGNNKIQDNQQESHKPTTTVLAGASVITDKASSSPNNVQEGKVDTTVSISMNQEPPPAYEDENWGSRKDNVAV